MEYKFLVHRIIFGQLKVKYVSLTTIIFSSLSVFALIGKIQFSILWLNDVPSEFFQTLPFVGSITIMIILTKTMSSPQALGKSYKKSKSN